MRPIELSLPFNRLARMLASFSVRTRIVLLALFRSWVLSPTFTAGEGDVGCAFATVTHSTALADVSRDFKSAVASMRIIVKDFSVSPDNKLVVSFAQAHATALKALETLAASIDQSHTENIAGLRKDLMSLRGNFNELLQEQKTLGFDDASGLHVPVAHPELSQSVSPWSRLALVSAG
jgi:hypothetical protein